MNKFYTLFRFLLIIFIIVIANNVHAQADTTTPAPVQPIPQNAGFDVIIKNNGDIVYGLVKEVTPTYISYKRTDIPDGPVYTIPRSEVYAISYRNQMKEYMNPANVDGAPATANNLNNPYPYNIDYKKNNLFKHGGIRLGVGFLRSFSKVENAKDYSSSGSFPAITIAYETYYKNNVFLGAQIGFGSHNFSNEEFSSYDSTINNIDIKENTFGLYIYARYTLMNTTSRLQPYLMGGLGITSSHIKSETTINFTNDNSQTILVSSGARSAGVGIMARAGAEYFINPQFHAFIDAGVGLSVLKVGISATIQ